MDVSDLLEACVEGILSQRFVVCAHVQLQRQALARVDPRTRRVQVQLPDCGAQRVTTHGLASLFCIDGESQSVQVHTALADAKAALQ